MGTPVSPTMVAVGRMIRRYREAAGLLQAVVADRLGYSEGWMSNLETGQLKTLRSDQLAALAEVLNIPAGVLEDVYGIREGESLPGWMRSWVDEEERATVLRSFEHAIVPGLLQTENYARVLLDGDEAAVRVRLDRQWILSRDDPEPPTLHCVISETVLHTEVGSKEIMREQLEHLLSLASSRISIRVVPANVIATMMGAFVIASVDAGTVCYVETPVRGIVTSSRDDVARLTNRWDSIQIQAFPMSMSLELIEKAIIEEWT